MVSREELYFRLLQEKGRLQQARQKKKLWNDSAKLRESKLNRIPAKYRHDQMIRAVQERERAKKEEGKIAKAKARIRKIKAKADTAGISLE